MTPSFALAFASAPETTVLEVLSPRVARVRGLGHPVLYCKRVESAHQTLPEAQELLLREGQILVAAARSTAGHRVPRIVSQGHDAHGPYLLVAPLEGASLANGKPSGALIATRVRAFFEALSDLHAASIDNTPLGLVHGDISPDNVLYTDHDVTFVDWELGRCTGVADLGLGPFRGTLAYVAPEVAAGERPSQAADVFALGLALLELCVGAPLRKQRGAAGILEAAETPIDLEAAFSAPAGATIAHLRDFFAAVLAPEGGERPRDGGAALHLL